MAAVGKDALAALSIDSALSALCDPDPRVSPTVLPAACSMAWQLVHSKARHSNAGSSTEGHAFHDSDNNSSEWSFWLSLCMHYVIFALHTLDPTRLLQL